MPALSQNLTFIINSTSTGAVVYPNTGTTMLTYTSNKVKGDGYYGSSDGFHTVMYNCTFDFVGTVTMQATLATAPTESDWFNVTNTTSTYTALNVRSTGTVDYYNFQGNFVWVRSQVKINDGSVLSIDYNH